MWRIVCWGQHAAGPPTPLPLSHWPIPQKFMETRSLAWKELRHENVSQALSLSMFAVRNWLVPSTAFACTVPATACEAACLQLLGLRAYTLLLLSNTLYMLAASHFSKPLSTPTQKEQKEHQGSIEKNATRYQTGRGVAILYILRKCVPSQQCVTRRHSALEHFSSS